MADGDGNSFALSPISFPFSVFTFIGSWASRAEGFYLSPRNLLDTIIPFPRNLGLLIAHLQKQRWADSGHSKVIFFFIVGVETFKMILPGVSLRRKITCILPRVMFFVQTS